MRTKKIRTFSETTTGKAESCISNVDELVNGYLSKFYAGDVIAVIPQVTEVLLQDGRLKFRYTVTVTVTGEEEEQKPL